MHTDIHGYLLNPGSSIFLEITKSRDNKVHIQNCL